MKEKKNNQGKGLLTALIVWIIFMIISQIALNQQEESVEIIITISLICLIGGLFYEIVIIFKKTDRRYYEEENIPKELIEIKKQEKEKDKAYIKKLEDVTYVGGHEKFSKISKGVIGIKEGILTFYINNRKYIGYDYTIIKNEIFSLATKNIKKITYELSEQITAVRYLLIGIASFAFKKKTYYLIIDYVSENGVDNQVIFETGSEKDQNFYNELNVQRNKYISVKSETEEIKNITSSKDNESDIYEQIKNLGELKSMDLISEEEYNEKKKILLDKIN
ncbi:MAG: SHOCT domain-containing protein [Eubacteriales bacterium]